MSFKMILSYMIVKNSDLMSFDNHNLLTSILTASPPLDQAFRSLMCSLIDV